MATPAIKALHGTVDLLFTSPPFPLVRKKRYGNETGQKYLSWLQSLAPKFKKLLSPRGSLVIEIGNAWEDGDPVMSTLPLRALLAFKEAGRFHLCQHVICHNPARLPGPAAWVTIERIRLKDSFTHVWWLSAVKRPKASNSNVLLPYSTHMRALLARQEYNAGTRPSGHNISKSGFLKNHGGAIAPNVLDIEGEGARRPGSLLQFTGTGWDSGYRAYCKQNGLDVHPARMQAGLAGFFIQLLTDKDDLVFDPFGGSNTTGAVAEALGRRWVAVEADERYAKGSRGRFPGPHLIR